MKWFIAALLTVMLAGAGCSKKGDEGTAGKDTKAGETAAAGPELTDQDLPVATDFAEEAEAQITAENYKGEIDKLEQEIAAE